MLAKALSIRYGVCINDLSGIFTLGCIYRL